MHLESDPPDPTLAAVPVKTDLNQPLESGETKRKRNVPNSENVRKGRRRRTVAKNRSPRI
jgi:hypothetical protein